MNQYKNLLEYISYFEDETNDYCTWVTPESKEDGVTVIGYPQYDERLVKFIKDVYESDLLKTDYLEYLEKLVGKDGNLNDYMKSADMELLRAILTYYVRQERFCDGVWAQAAKNKIFLNILYRLRQG